MERKACVSLQGEPLNVKHVIGQNENDQQEACVAAQGELYEEKRVIRGKESRI